MEGWQKVIKEETEKCDVTSFMGSNGKSYPYVILPFESRMTPEFRRSVAEGMTRMLYDEINKATVILLPEAKGFLLSLLSNEIDLDFAMIRKRDYRTPEQIKIIQRKAYREKKGEYGEDCMYCVGLRKGDRPLLIDDIISSGGTTDSVNKALLEHKHELVGIGAFYERGTGVRDLQKMDYNVKALVRLDLRDGKPFVPSFYKC